MPDFSSQVSSLPEPSAEARVHSQRLEAILKQRILEQGSMSFQDFMQAALYEPGMGYYRCGTQKFGYAGDFITAPESSNKFGECLANFVRQTDASESILEVGAGSGKLALSILKSLAEQDCLPISYAILELSAELRERQRELIANELPEFIEQVHWLDKLPEQFTGIVIANELLDAMPVRRFVLRSTNVYEQYVDVDDGQLTISEVPVTDDQRVLDRVNEILEQTSMGEVDEFFFEINFIAEDWIKSLADSLASALVVLIDYGYPRSAYYHAQRNMGTLMCYFQHRAHSQPLLHTGIQDITAHVDFTAMADAALAAGMDIDGFTTQAHFLLNMGLLDGMNEPDDNLAGYLQATGEIKRLTLPGEMGETFKVMVISKQYDGPIPGFEFNDIRHLL